ncbi:MAG: hypothetical protein ACM3JQ_04070, partial [Candidatus Eiseniibacteriota bacterium]
MKNLRLQSIGLAAILLTAVLSMSTLVSNTIQFSNAQDASKTTVVRDSQTILLEGKTLPAKDFIHLYDTT